MTSPTLIQATGAVLFRLAVRHTFSTRYFEQLAHPRPRHAGPSQPPGEVEVVFGFRAMVPLLGSFITEPAAMTLAARMLRDTLSSRPLSIRLRYATVGVRFVKSPSAARCALRRAAGADGGCHRGLGPGVHGHASSVGAAVPRRTGPHEHCAGDTGGGGAGRHRRRAIAVPGRRGGVAHDPPVFLGLFLFFPVFAAACERHHDRLIPREALRVAFFLAGRVVLWTPTPGSSAPSR
jgi:hypothetical protein